MRTRSSRFGFACPRCGERQCSVVRTTSLTSVVIRMRRCEVCGKEFSTTETALDLERLVCDAAGIVLSGRDGARCREGG